ncbi:MAG: ferritin family protein [bacterium]
MIDLITETKLAIELEKKGYDLYFKVAAKTSNPLAASTMSSLADRELLHIERIRSFYLDMTGEKKLPSDWLKGVEVSPTKEELLLPIFNKLKLNLNKKFETQADISESYVIAEGLERDSYHLYDKLSKGSTNEIAKKFFAALAIEEREHYSILEDTLLYLNDPGEWYRLQERWIVEGG